MMHSEIYIYTYRSRQGKWLYVSIHQSPSCVINAFSLLYHTFWCKYQPQHISLKFIYSVTLICLPAAGFVRRWLPCCFESRARAAVARAAIFLVARSSKCVSDIMLKWKMKLWTVTRVIMCPLCDHSVEASKDWVLGAHFINFLNTTMPMPMPMPCTDVHSGAPMSHFLHRRVGMGCQALNFRSQANYVLDVTHACLFAKCTTPVQ